MEALEIKGLNHEYEGLTALTEASFSVADRELFCVLGPNGSGKSTLFRCISTLLKPTSGAVKLCGEIDLIHNPGAARRRIGTVFQQPVLDPALTIRENLRIAAALYGVARDVAASRMTDLADLLGVADRLDSRVGQLSGGLARRADLLRGILHDPAILLLDEPTTGLDPAARHRFWQVIDGIRSKNESTILFTSHLMEEADSADRLMILDRGRVVAMGTSEDLREEASGSRIEIRSTRNEEISDWLSSRFSVEILRAPGALHVRSGEAQSVFDDLLGEWGHSILELTIRKPSLEDIFFERTGSLWDTAEASFPGETGNKA